MVWFVLFIVSVICHRFFFIFLVFQCLYCLFYVICHCIFSFGVFPCLPFFLFVFFCFFSVVFSSVWSLSVFMFFVCFLVYWCFCVICHCYFFLVVWWMWCVTGLFLGFKAGRSHANVADLHRDDQHWRSNLEEKPFQRSVPFLSQQKVKFRVEERSP